MWLFTFLLITGALSTLVVHELAHLFAARAFGINALAVTIGVGPVAAKFTDDFGTSWKLRVVPVGASCSFPDGPASQPVQSVGPRSLRSISLQQRAIILLAGPFANAALAGALFLATFVQDSSFSIARLGTIGAIGTFLVGVFSMAVALFSILPIFPLDGGRLILLAFEALTGREISRRTESVLLASGVILLSIIGALAAIFFVATPSLKFS